MSVKINQSYLSKFIKPHEYEALVPQVLAAHELLHSKSGLGSEFTGWLNLPSEYNKNEFERIKKAAQKIKSNSDILVVIGIGGSYLGARAIIELLKSQHYNSFKKDTPDIYFIGNSISSTELCEILEICEGKNISVNIISKSGTTTEPAIAFRVFKNIIEQKYGKIGAKERIFCTTDKSKGALKNLADKEGFETFVVPDDVGGRYSVLTAVGLLPIAVAGIKIDDLMNGAKIAQKALSCPDISYNDCYKYAAIRNILYRKGKDTEILASYEPRFAMMGEWFKQLFGESEGKDEKGLFPASATFSTDLHSMGQYIQDGKRNLFETVLFIDKPIKDLKIESDSENIDGLNFLSGKNVSYVNKKAFEGTLLAHTDGNVPNIVLTLPELNEFELGYMIYFFEKACAISGYIMGVNPFNQPGVENYKKNMFALLGKPGFEDKQKVLQDRLNQF